MVYIEYLQSACCKSFTNFTRYAFMYKYLFEAFIFCTHHGNIHIIIPRNKTVVSDSPQ